MKKKIAIWMPGGLGAGINSQGIPTISQLVDHFSTQYEVHVYMHALPDNHFAAKGFSLRSSPKWIANSVFRWLYLIIYFFVSHFRKKHSAILSFWGYPSGTIAVILGKLFFSPSVVFILGGETANLPEFNYGLLRNASLRKRILWTCENASLMIAVTQYQVNQLQKHGLKREVKIIPWGADKNLFHAAKKERPSHLRIIHVANLNPVKDQETLVKAFALIQEKIMARLKIVGPDTMNGKIQSLVKELNLENLVEFAGGVPYHQIPELLTQSDMFVLTSRSEGQNNAITEAMTSGLLAASTRVGIMADLGDEYGIVVDIGDYEMLARKIVEIARDTNQWQAKVDRSLDWSQTHDLSWTLKQLDDCLFPLINA